MSQRAFKASRVKSWGSLLGVSLLAAARPCFAWQAYPDTVAATWRLKKAPDCIVCHVSDLGGRGTATKPFAQYLQQQGLGAQQDTTLLANLLEQARSCEVDSDGDGVSDFAEINNAGNGATENADPNDGAGETTSLCGDVFDGPLPQTGCALARNAVAADGLWLPMALVGLLALRRQRRRS